MVGREVFCTWHGEFYCWRYVPNVLLHFMRFHSFFQSFSRAVRVSDRRHKWMITFHLYRLYFCTLILLVSFTTMHAIARVSTCSHWQRVPYLYSCLRNNLAEIVLILSLTLRFYFSLFLWSRHPSIIHLFINYKAICVMLMIVCVPHLKNEMAIAYLRFSNLHCWIWHRTKEGKITMVTGQFINNNLINGTFLRDGFERMHRNT